MWTFSYPRASDTIQATLHELMWDIVNNDIPLAGGATRSMCRLAGPPPDPLRDHAVMTHTAVAFVQDEHNRMGTLFLDCLLTLPTGAVKDEFLSNLVEAISACSIPPDDTSNANPEMVKLYTQQLQNKYACNCVPLAIAGIGYLRTPLANLSPHQTSVYLYHAGGVSASKALLDIQQNIRLVFK